MDRCSRRLTWTRISSRSSLQGFAWPHSSPVLLLWYRVVCKRQALEAVRNRTQVASRKNSRPSPEAAEAVRNRVQVAPQRNSRPSPPVVEAARRNSAVRTIKNKFSPVLFLGTEQVVPLRTVQANQLKTEYDKRRRPLPVTRKHR
jgi:hypothetical protein